MKRGGGIPRVSLKSYWIIKVYKSWERAAESLTSILQLLCCSQPADPSCNLNGLWPHNNSRAWKILLLSQRWKTNSCFSRHVEAGSWSLLHFNRVCRRVERLQTRTRPRGVLWLDNIGGYFQADFILLQVDFRVCEACKWNVFVLNCNLSSARVFTASLCICCCQDSRGGKKAFNPYRVLPVK